MDTATITKIMLGAFLLLIGVALTISYIAGRLDIKIKEIEKSLTKPEIDQIEAELEKRKHTISAKISIIRKYKQID